MKQYRLQLAITGLLAALAFGTVQAEVRASGYTFTTVDVPSVDVGDSYLTGINLLGQASGIRDAGSEIYGLVYFLGQYSLFADPMGSGTFALGISDDGFIVGRYGDDHGHDHAYMLTGGTFLTLSPPNSYDVSSRGVNNLGHAVGDYGDNNLPQPLGFLYRHGTYTAISDPSGLETNANGINDLDQVVGTYYYLVPQPNGSVEYPKGFFDDRGTFTDIAVPGAVGTFASGINNLGEIVGSFYNSDFNGNDQGFVYQNGTYTTLSVPGSISTTPLGVNQLGVIVGIYGDSNNVGHSFIATPN